MLIPILILILAESGLISDIVHKMVFSFKSGTFCKKKECVKSYCTKMQIRLCKLFGPTVGESQGFKVKFRYSEKGTKTWPIFHI